MFEGVRASPGAGLRSCVIGSGCWNDCFSWFSAPRFAVEGPRQDGKGTGPRVQVPARPAAWPGSHWGCSPLLCPSWHSGPSRAQVRLPPAAPYTCLWECHSIPTAWVCRARPPPPFRAWAHPTPTPQGVAHGTKPLRQSCCPVRGVPP